VGGVNADDDKSLPSQYNVKGFPTVKIIYGGKVKDYDGPRTARGIVDAALKVVQEKVDSSLGGKSSSGSGGSGTSYFAYVFM
jgi:protein disulfide-isomerase A6